MATAKKGDWVQIENIVLPAGQRAPQVPEDTQKCDLKLWVKVREDWRNRENLLRELDAILGHLGEYRAAIAQSDASTLRRLLEEGRQRKEAVDGKGTNTPDPN